MTTDDPKAARKPASSRTPACTLRCPICSNLKALDEAPRLGGYVLCDSCLGVLIVDQVRTKAGDGLGVRALAPEDLAKIPSDVQQELLEEKVRRMRARAAVEGRPTSWNVPTLRDLLVGIERHTDGARPTLLQLAERELERVDELEREHEKLLTKAALADEIGQLFEEFASGTIPTNTFYERKNAWRERWRKLRS